MLCTSTLLYIILFPIQLSSIYSAMTLVAQPLAQDCWILEFSIYNELPLAL